MKTKKTPHNLPEETASQLYRSSLKLLRVLRDKRSENSLSSAKLAVLGRLYKGGSTTASDLAAYLRILPQSLTRLIAELEKDGLISRQKSLEDRRRILLDITKEGRARLSGQMVSQRMLLANIISRELSSDEQDLLCKAMGLIDRVSGVLAEFDDNAGQDSGPQEDM